MEAYAGSLDAYLRAQEHKGLLRFITCGSVDDGKSTLIGRLLYESKTLLDDQLDSLKAESERIGTQGGNLDFALLVDGLAAEREQGITIDVAYRFFATDKRKFIVADTPGHEQYTRNMATGASTADLAVILADAGTFRGELLTQTRRHTYIVSMLGIRHLVLAVNKMDMVAYDQGVFDSLAGKYREFAKHLGVEDVQCIPMSALKGDNVVTRSDRMPWYDGPALLPFLETVDFEGEPAQRPFRMPVQWVNRPSSEFRGFAGTITSGTLGQGDRITASPWAHEARVARIVTKDGDLAKATSGQAVTVVLDREIDISRGNVLCSADEPVATSDQFAVHLLWMATDEMLPGRFYLIKIGTNTAQAMVTSLKHKINVNTLEQTASKTLGLNEIGVCTISLDKAIPFEPFAQSRDLGAFILIDRVTNGTVGMGLIDFALRRATDIHWQGLDVSREARAMQKGQRPAVIWLTGRSGAGKSAIATALEKRLYSIGLHTCVLDEDTVRRGLNRDLGHTDADRVENIRRVAEVARLMADSGLIVLVSITSPLRSERALARGLIRPDELIEVLVDAPPDASSAYEPPEDPEIRLESAHLSPEGAVETLLEYLHKRGLTKPAT